MDMSKLFSTEETIKRIQEGRPLILAAHESLLKKLPAGNWIAGTIPYFMCEDGGGFTEGHILVSDLPEDFKSFTIKDYTADQLSKIPLDYYENGFSIMLLPGLSDIQSKFAKDCLTYQGIFSSPLVGWVTGVKLEKIGQEIPQVANGLNKSLFKDRAIVMHVELPEHKIAQLDIINIFEKGDGDVIEFPETSFEARSCLINGKSAIFSDYLKEHKIDIRFPLIADYAGAKINVSFQGVDEKTGLVSFYAPVFSGVKYRLAKPINEYENEFDKELRKRNLDPVFSCNCILNYVYAGLENKKAGAHGPMTFGEIAYMLLNQTMVCLHIKDLEP